MKQLFIYYATASFVMKDRIFEYFSNISASDPEEAKKDTEIDPTEK